MAKRKNRPKRKYQPLLNAPKSNQSCEDKLRTLSWELALAGGQVLQEHFGFTKEQTSEWLELMTKRAQANRANGDSNR